MTSSSEILHWFCPTCGNRWLMEPNHAHCPGCEDDNLPSKILPYEENDRLNDKAESQLDAFYDS